MLKVPTLVRASGTLTFTGLPVNAETFAVAGKTYTVQTSLTDVDGNIKIGADITAMASNVAAAINKGSGSGTAYAASMTENAHVYATSAAGVVTFVAKIPGTIGNFVTLTESLSNATPSGAVLASGSGDYTTAISNLRTAGQVNANVLQVLDAMDQSGTAEE